MEAPVLAYPNLEKAYTLETDASIKGLGAILSQRQQDGKLHPVAYASRAFCQDQRGTMESPIWGRWLLFGLSPTSTQPLWE